MRLVGKKISDISYVTKWRVYDDFWDRSLYTFQRIEHED